MAQQQVEADVLEKIFNAASSNRLAELQRLATSHPTALTMADSSGWTIVHHLTALADGGPCV